MHIVKIQHSCLLLRTSNFESLENKTVQKLFETTIIIMQVSCSKINSFPPKQIQILSYFIEFESHNKTSFLNSQFVSNCLILIKCKNLSKHYFRINWTMIKEKYLNAMMSQQLCVCLFVVNKSLKNHIRPIKTTNIENEDIMYWKTS